MHFKTAVSSPDDRRFKLVNAVLVGAQTGAAIDYHPLFSNQQASYLIKKFATCNNAILKAN